MDRLLKISEAASLAIHAMSLMAASDHPLTVQRMASGLQVSEAHLGKVLQRLAKFGMLSSTRGPKGGFSIIGAASEISLLTVWEATDGPLAEPRCLLNEPACKSCDSCPLQTVERNIHDIVVDTLGHTYLTDIAVDLPPVT